MNKLEFIDKNGQPAMLIGTGELPAPMREFICEQIQTGELTPVGHGPSSLMADNGVYPAWRRLDDLTSR